MMGVTDMPAAPGFESALEGVEKQIKAAQMLLDNAELIPHSDEGAKLLLLEVFIFISFFSFIFCFFYFRFFNIFICFFSFIFFSFYCLVYFFFFSILTTIGYLWN